VFFVTHDVVSELYCAICILFTCKIAQDNSGTTMSVFKVILRHLIRVGLTFQALSLVLIKIQNMFEIIALCC
jgi:hypothetical protein